ncbi:hypothetical protein [Rummeliibacillus sp. POC4]|uniref:hypothetical protein n=1 Tax=Rummeliibacillus sp. POC4 TaxID=2305899 RepID=UPI00131440BE|nr:hypothetical protein [Rummeliibacillus sp. POC4]
MGKFLILTVAFTFGYFYLAWKMDDRIGPIFVILILLAVNYIASRIINAVRKNR